MSGVLLHAELLAHNLATRFVRENRSRVALKECLYFMSNYTKVKIPAITKEST